MYKGKIKQTRFYIKLVLLIVVLIPCFAFSQDILWDDVNSQTACITTFFPETLIAHGLNIHCVSIEGWDNLENMDALWIFTPNPTYSFQTLSDIVSFARNGGNIILSCYTGNLNPILSFPEWDIDTRIIQYDAGHWMDTVYIGYGLFRFPPFTDRVEGFHNGGSSPKVIAPDEKTFPFAFVSNEYDRPFIAITYPFVDEGNCSTFIFIHVHAHMWDDTEVLEYRFNEGGYKLGINIFSCAAGVPGYELEPCATPEIPAELFGHNCLRYPNPFTPNNDKVNDYVQFEFDGLGTEDAVVVMYDLHGHKVRELDIPGDYRGKQFARWLGDDNHSRPLPQGVYIYVIESGGEIVCEGTVTIAR